MPSALSALSGAPQPGPGNAAMQPPAPPTPAAGPSGGMMPSPGGNGPLGPPQGQQQAPPPPSRQQTLTALHHFHMMESEARTLLEDPACGKSDLRSEIIDASTRLVSEGIVAPAEAVQLLGTVPDRPFEQKQWLLMHVQQFQQAENAILDHYRMGVAQNGGAVDNSAYEPENHATVMTGLLSHYGGKS